MSGAPSGARVTPATAVSSSGATIGDPRDERRGPTPPSSRRTGRVSAVTASRTASEPSRRRSFERLRQSTGLTSRRFAARDRRRVTKRDILQYIDSARRPRARAHRWLAFVARPTAGRVAGRRHRADVEDALAHQRAHGGVSAHVRARHSFFEADFTRIARIRLPTAPSSSARWREADLPAVRRQSRRRRATSVPGSHSSVRGNEIIYRKQYNIGIAVALDWGLIVPVIRNADNLSVTGLARVLSDLAERARLKRLDPAEVQGGSLRLRIPAFSVPSWAHRSSISHRSAFWPWRDRETSEGDPWSGRRGRDRHSNVRLSVALVRSSNRRRSGCRQVPRVRETGNRNLS